MDADIVSIAVDHINAEPQDSRYGHTWERAAMRSPWLRRHHLEALKARHPSIGAPETTVITSNHDAWSSMSEYLEEMADDSAAARVHMDMVGGVVEYHRKAFYADAEIRENDRDLTLFSWRRPLVRMATHITVNVSNGGENVARMLAGRYSAEITQAGTNIASILVPHSPAQVEEQIRMLLAPGTPISSW